MKVKTNELNGAALDWAVAKCESEGELAWAQHRGAFAYSSTWVCGGPIIERDIDQITRCRTSTVEWEAVAQGDSDCTATGPTPLIAAMRCYVASKLGDEVDVPNELMTND